MRNITTLQEAEAALRPYVPLVAQLTGKDTTLQRITALMALLGNPEKKLRVVHIAGTSGKTSTAYYMAALLRAAGKNVGLTVSPHVDSVTERVQLNGQPMPVQQFCTELAEFLEIVDTAAEKPSYFELLYAFAIWVFARSGVDYAVLETGMGGLHDATNVAARPDKYCIITDIGLDHTHILGTTLPEIAAQKVGIVHEHNSLLMYKQAPEIMAVVAAWTNDHQAPLTLVDQAAEQKYGAFDQHMPLYQQRNWLLAYRAYRELAKRDNLPSLTEAQLAMTQAVQVPGRMDVRTVQGKTLVMDGAHNVQKMTTFIKSFQRAYPGVRPAVLLALKKDKDSAALGPLLADFAARVIVTTFASSQDLPAMPTDPEALAETFRQAGVTAVTAEPDSHAAYQQLLAAPEPVGVITGSFYLLSQIRNREDLA
jgi:dihydrofolate synthase/folylpolyglutamate synthase